MSALLIRPVAFRLKQVHDAIRSEMPVCPVGSKFFALLPALTPTHFPLVVVVKISFPPLLRRGAIFSPDLLGRLGVIRHLGLEGMCGSDDEEPCICYHNGIEMNEQASLIESADFISCHKGRSYTTVEEEVVTVSDAESVIMEPITWRIIPLSKWLVTMVSKSPNWGCSPCKWPKWLISGGY